MTDLISLPVLTDNYIHIICDDEFTIVVDPAEATPVLNFLASRPLTHILITHHHWDHVGGVIELKKQTGCKVIGAEIDRHRLPPLDQAVTHGQKISIGSFEFKIQHLPGHTLGHIAYAADDIVFSGDVLFGMGCGRVFEGTMEQAFNSLQFFKTLKPETRIYCTHEYTERNGEFAVTQLPANQAIHERLLRTQEIRRRNKLTVPLNLGEEFATNPFLLAKNLAEFTHLRDARNRF